MCSQVRQIIRVRETTHFVAVCAECESSSRISCGFCDIHKYVLCEFVYRRIWNHALSVNHMRSRIPEHCTLNYWHHSQKWTHLSLYTGSNSWTTDMARVQFRFLGSFLMCGVGYLDFLESLSNDFEGKKPAVAPLYPASCDGTASVCLSDLPGVPFSSFPI